MATKTFKIGLSNTDKQNMAQEVYERLLALTFPEYDTTESYDVGDFVVYNDQLYKCIGSTTGAWDSSKWQLATLNDLLTDIEDAVAFVNDKANVDGNYPTMTVGFADALTPYDSDSGDDQDEPFSFQATGTGNGTQPDFATGSTALMKEKRGNTVVVNKLLQNGDFSNGTTGWTTTNGTTNVVNGVATITSTGGNVNFYHAVTQKVQGHKVLVMFIAQASTSLTLRINWGSGLILGIPLTVTKTAFFYIGDVGTGDTDFNLVVNNTTAGDTISYSKISVIDLTQWFNGDIPSDLLAHPEHFFRYYQGDLSFNEGTLVNANSRYIKCIGRNQWDEEWDNGTIDFSTGQNASGTTVRSKNYIPCIPSSIYYFSNIFDSQSAINFYMFFYDANKNFISYKQLGRNDTFSCPSNACYMRFYLASTSVYGTAYHNDITISIYYEDESGYDQYYPYEVLTNNDTGVEVLRSAGSVADIKLPSGEIKRNVGVVDLGTLNWEYYGQYGGHELFYSDGLISLIAHNDNTKIYGICALYKAYPNVYDAADGQYLLPNMAFRVRTSDGRIYFNNDTYDNAGTFKTAMSGVYLFYELAEPTTEQGTPYSENLFIDDFGSMDFEGTSGVPQGNLIFYPVDYKAFTDTLYNYTDGTPSNIALKSDLSNYQPIIQDLSSGLTKNSSLYNVIKKAYKLGNIVFLTITGINISAETVAAGTTLYTLASGLYNPSGDMNFGGDGYTIHISTSGELSINADLTQNKRYDICICYCVA